MKELWYSIDLNPCQSLVPIIMNRWGRIRNIPVPLILLPNWSGSIKTMTWRQNWNHDRNVEATKMRQQQQDKSVEDKNNEATAMRTMVMKQQQQDKSVEDKNNEATAMRTTVVRQQQGGHQWWGQQWDVNSDDERGSAWNDIWARADISDSSTSCRSRTVQHHPFQLFIEGGVSVMRS